VAEAGRDGTLASLFPSSPLILVGVNGAGDAGAGQVFGWNARTRCRMGAMGRPQPGRISRQMELDKLIGPRTQPRDGTGRAGAERKSIFPRNCVDERCGQPAAEARTPSSRRMSGDRNGARQFDIPTWRHVDEG
jgi:hypothetical protein